MMFKLVAVVLTLNGHVVSVSHVDEFMFSRDCENASAIMKMEQTSVMPPRRVIYVCSPQAQT